uniref:Uncharacterized protein n=1 Tax=Vitis vinifera TaxID=29760 RepID=A5AVS8_VITVI|nr:hypothetical protein VITISV_021517 [Vitis vinifera]
MDEDHLPYQVLAQHILGSFRRTSRHCAKWLRNSPGKRYKQIRICVTGEVETLSSPIRRYNSGCDTSRWKVVAPDVMAAAGCSGGNRM